MNRPRRARLLALTQGAALLGVGALAAACTKNEPTTNMNGPEPTATPAMNATMTPPTPSAPAAAGDAAAEATDASLPPRLPNMNALPHPIHVNGPAPTSAHPDPTPKKP